MGPYEGAEWEGEEIKPGAWGRDVESEDRLKTIIQEYFAADAERAKERPRKTIVFAVSEKQASILVRLFNRLMTDEDCLRIAQQINRSPSQVRQEYAKKITCYTNNGNPRPIIDQFKYDPLPLMAVSVDMLDTGYDHKEVENLVMLRPTKSAIKYAQMRGRGNRLCPRIGKTEFIVYDFAGNTKRFNDPGEAYHKPRLVGPALDTTTVQGDDTGGEITPDGTTEPKPHPEPRPDFLLIREGSLDDEIRAREIILVGPKGLAIDRKAYREKWEEKVIELRKSDVSRDCQVALSTVKEYYSILEDTLVGFFLYPYLKSARKRMSHQPKFYFFDNGVTRALLGSLQDPPTPLEQGRLFEQWILQEIVSLNEYDQKDWKLFFWRTSHGAEVDLLISRGTRLLYAIECKFKRQPSSSDLSGLRSFHDNHPEVPCFVVSPVKQPYRLSFARILPPNRLFQELK